MNTLTTLDYVPRAGLFSLAASALVVAGTMAYGESTDRVDFAIGGNWPITFGIIVGLVARLGVTALHRDKTTPNVEMGEGVSA
jgi:SSS family solute:Na+ symporter